MARLTDVERARLIDNWRQRHPGRAIPTNILPPGLGAPARAPARAVAKVRAIVDGQQRQLQQLATSDMRALLPIFERARQELAAKLERWITFAPDGELRWTAQHYRQALLQIDAGTWTLTDALKGRLEESTLTAQRMALADLVNDVARFSSSFEGMPLRLALDDAKLIASGRSFVIPRIESSARRYQGAVRKDLQERLATDILQGAPLRETIERLQEQGGPRGAVTLRGVAGEPGAAVEEITEGLFARHRYFAERIVRTEDAAAYGQQTIDGLDEAATMVPGLEKIWIVGAGCCALICAGLDGVVIPLDQAFDTPAGPCDANPAHPNCRCTVSAWHARWGEKGG